MSTALVHYGKPVNSLDEAARALTEGAEMNFVARRTNPDRMSITHFPRTTPRSTPITPEQLDPTTNRLHVGTFYRVS